MIELPAVPPWPQSGVFEDWIRACREWMVECHTQLQQFERPEQDPRVAEVEASLLALAEENAHLKVQLQARVCECCGLLDGICAGCGRVHNPAVGDGCEACMGEG